VEGRCNDWSPVQHAPAHLRTSGGLSVGTARLVGWGGVIGAAALPAVLLHRPIALIAGGFEWSLDYLVMGWLGYALIATAVLIMLPVVSSIGHTPASRFYPRRRNALIGWSASLYVMGMAIAAQVGQIATGLSAG
jgi:hypothetical protein